MAAVDYSFGGSDPAENLETVVPHDTDELGAVSRSLYIGGAGDVTVLTKGGQTKTFAAVPAGTILPIRVKRVNSTSTTATLMLSLY